MNRPPARAVAYDRRSSHGSRFAALCAVALVSLSGGLLFQLASEGASLVGPINVSWMFGPVGTIQVR